MGEQLLSHLIYVSVATQPMTSEMLDELVSVARRNNEKRRLTGMLLYKEQRFMQVLEGEDSVIGSLFDVIKLDSRHDKIDILRYEHIHYRSFPDWSMAFQNIDDIDVSGYEEIRELENLRLDAPYFNEPNFEAHELLLAFKSALWERH
ncbi:MAG: BLUF domain-containing protein [Pseudomonadota bacterium]